MQFFTICLLTALTIFTQADAALAQNLPSFWIGEEEETLKEKPSLRPKAKQVSGNSQRKVWAIGLGVNLPDLFPIEAYWMPSRWIGLRAFFVIPLPFDVRVEYGRSVLANQGGLSIENPDLVVDFDGIYGPQYGLETLIRPLGGNLYLGLGMSFRKLSLEGDLISDLILTSSAGSIETNSLISLQARADTAQIVYRASLGWLWTFWDDQCYLNFTLFGLTLPQRAYSNVSMRAKILNPIATVDVRNEIIEEAERRFADDLARQARESLRPVERLVAPIIGLSGGFSF